MSMIEETKAKTPWSLEMFLRKVFKNVLDSISGFLLKVGLTPNSVTILGVVLSTGVAVLIRFWIYTLGRFIDYCSCSHGRFRRVNGAPEGDLFSIRRLLDSVTDRYSEMIILGGLLVYYLQRGNAFLPACWFLSQQSVRLWFLIPKPERNHWDFQPKLEFLPELKESWF